MDYLYDMYLKTRSNKRRSEDSVIFEILQEKNLTEILNDINDRGLDNLSNNFDEVFITNSYKDWNLIDNLPRNVKVIDVV